ncbi:MAG: hypothetical protein OXU42_16160 [Deltaproteobacteria bacterium]|nr:hypothetical protein [Deltaproteobacteria bacterium]
MLSAWRDRGEAGSGMTIGVAIVFPMLVITVMVLQTVADSARIEQNLQATANRAAQTASLCCHRTDRAYETARASLATAERAGAFNKLFCNNDLLADSVVVFEDVGGGVVARGGSTVASDTVGYYLGPDAFGNYLGPGPPVPPAGRVHVYLRCSVPPQILGSFALGVFDTERTVVATATIDPHRSRTGT